MPTPVRSALTHFTNALREFTVGQRTIAIIGIIAIIIGAAVLGTWLSRPNYVTLFSGLSASDASAIVEQLSGANVPYEIADGGASVLVPASDVDEQRLAVAAAGLPTLSSGGYSLLDSLGVTSSEFQQTVTYKRALEGELASTIESIAGVRTAVVQLAIPKESVFVSETADPTASVFVDTESRFEFTTEQVTAITHLMAASVGGLTPENVSVVDSNGTVLSAVGEGTTGGIDQQSTAYEQRVRSAVQAMLDTVVGVGNATVAVSANISGESAQRVEEAYETPTESPATSESSTKESFVGDQSGASGVLGSSDAAVTGDSGTGTYTSESATRDNAINKVTETRTIPAGEVTRQTVSVAINSDQVKGMTRSTISDLVAAAAGIDSDRGDLVTVELVPFSTLARDGAASVLESARAEEQRTVVTNLITTAILGGVAALAIISLAIVLKRRRRAAQGEPATEEPLLSTMLFPVETIASVETLPAAPLPAAVEPLDSDPQSFARLRADIEAMAGADPSRTADQLRRLMDERTS